MSSREIAADAPAPQGVTERRSVSAGGPSTRPRTFTFDVHERRRLLLLGDGVAAAVAALLGLGAWGVAAGDVVTAQWVASRAIWIPILTAAWLFCSALTGSYLPHVIRTRARSLVQILSTAVLFLGTYLLLFFVAPRTLLPRIAVLGFVAFAALLVAAWRRVWSWAHGRTAFTRRALVVGTGETSRSIAELLTAQPRSGWEIVGFVEGDPKRLNDPEGPHPIAPIVGDTSELSELAESYGASEVVLATGNEHRPDLAQGVLSCHERGVAITNASECYERLLGRVSLDDLAHGWDSILPLPQRTTGALYRGTKRLIDILGALTGLTLSLPLIPVIALAIKLDSGAPIIYRQMRSGRGRRRFNILKFRTMRADAEPDGAAVWAMEQDPRTTTVGRWLRRSRLDEIPQLWNVLKGEMSLVGPRPERPEIEGGLEPTMPFYRLRFAVKPGLASWHAVNSAYVNDLDGARARLEYDLYYLKHQSLWLDLQIMLRAMGRVFMLRGQ